MKLALFKISAFVFPLLMGTEATAFPGPPPPPQVCLQVAVHPFDQVGLPADSGRVGFLPLAGSTAHRCPGAGSAVGAVFPDRPPLHTLRIFRGQKLARSVVWLRIASLRAVLPGRSPLPAT